MFCDFRYLLQKAQLGARFIFSSIKKEKAKRKSLSSCYSSWTNFHRSMKWMIGGQEEEKYRYQEEKSKVHHHPRSSASSSAWSITVCSQATTFFFSFSLLYTFILFASNNVVVSQWSELWLLVIPLTFSLTTRKRGNARILVVEYK